MQMRNMDNGQRWKLPISNVAIIHNKTVGPTMILSISLMGGDHSLQQNIYTRGPGRAIRI